MKIETREEFLTRRVAERGEEIERLKSALHRVCDCLRTFIRETTDPGTEALAALYEAENLL
jgi:hypothetical protein